MPDVQYPACIINPRWLVTNYSTYLTTEQYHVAHEFQLESCLEDKMAPRQKVLLLGATGETGASILNGLLASNQFVRFPAGQTLHLQIANPKYRM